MRNSTLEVDLSAISYNMKQIQSLLSATTQIMPVIKANGYGLGVLALKEVLEENQIKRVAVAILEEAITLREHGWKMPIVLLNEASKEEAEEIVKQDITPGLCIFEVAEEINKIAKREKKKVSIHIQVDTGMGRVGIFPEQVLPFIKKIQTLENIMIEGIYTHFSSADSSESYTQEQIKKWKTMLQTLEENNIIIPYIHASASSGIINFKEAHYNLVRPGLILYGYVPEESMLKKISLKPAAKLKSRITFLKEVPEGTYISYSRNYQTTKTTKVATIGMGYADGVRRVLSNNR